MQQWWDEHDILNKYLTRNEQLRSAGHLWMARSPPTIRWVYTTPGAVPTKTSGSVSTRCAAIASGTRTASIARDCGWRWRSRKNSVSPTSTRSKNMASTVSWSGVKSVCCATPPIADRAIYPAGRMDATGITRTTRCRRKTTTPSGTSCKHLLAEGLDLRGRDVMPWCPRCATGISDMEINEGRREVAAHQRLCALPAGRPPRRISAGLDDDSLDPPGQRRRAVNPH